MIYNTIDNIIDTEKSFYCKNCKNLQLYYDKNYVKINGYAICNNTDDGCFKKLFSRYDLFNTDEQGDDE